MFTREQLQVQADELNNLIPNVTICSRKTGEDCTTSLRWRIGTYSNNKIVCDFVTLRDDVELVTAAVFAKLNCPDFPRNAYFQAYTQSTDRVTIGFSEN